MTTMITTKLPNGKLFISGYKVSGVGSEQGVEVLEAYTQIKSIYVDLS